MKNTTRELVTLAVFGTLWGVVEISLGSVLHGINIPMTGLVLAAVGLMIALIGRAFVPKRGSTIFVGVIATILKLFSIGAIIIGPMIGILAEALIAELVLSIFGRPTRASFIWAGMLGVLWTLVQPFVSGLLLFGRDLLSVWLEMLESGGRLFGLGTQAMVWIFGALLLMHLAVGALAGWLGWSLAGSINSRLGRNATPVVK